MDELRQSVGDLLRDWRRRRRFSQLTLAVDAEVSTRHLSFVESGRAQPSRGLLLRLAERLGLPLRERDRLLLAAGYAPQHGARPLDAPDMAVARAAVEQVLAGQEPYPALAVDRYWTLVAANRAVAPLLEGVAPALLAPPVNVLRLSLHPDGLAPRIENLGEWRHHLLARLASQAEAAADPRLHALLEELRALPGRAAAAPPGQPDGIAVPLRLRHPRSGFLLSLLSTTLVFGTATDVTLAELAVECFFPFDAASRAALLDQPGSRP